MSIIQSLKKLVDPIAAREEEAEIRDHRQQPFQAEQGDPPTFTCRVCGYQDQEGSYCPTCLAPTMELTPRVSD